MLQKLPCFWVASIFLVWVESGQPFLLSVRLSWDTPSPSGGGEHVLQGQWLQGYLEASNPALSSAVSTGHMQLMSMKCEESEEGSGGKAGLLCFTGGSFIW